MPLIYTGVAPLGYEPTMPSRNRRRNIVLLAIVVMALATCLPASAVVWQYTNNSTLDSELNLSGQTPAVPGSSALTEAQPGEDRTAKASGNLWSWGSSPRGFKVRNGKLIYPDDYYTSHFNMGYNKSAPVYGQVNMQNLSRYYTGFATGYIVGAYPGYNINKIHPGGEKSSWDPWNNYPGDDPNYPYGQGGSS